jgi:glutathione S-transferase
MKLYYSTGSCSLSPRIALHEAGLAYEGVLAPTKTKLLPDGSDFRAINPKGYVPMLELDDGQRLTEGAAIVQYIADQAPDKQLAPANGTLARYRLQEWLNFIAGELHKGGFGVFFNPAANDEFKAATRERLAGRLRWVDEQLEGKTWLMGEQFSVADGYLFNITHWSKPTGVDLAPYPNLLAWRARVAARPAVQAAMQAEGLAG